MTASPRWLGFLAGALLLGAAGGFVACREGATQDSPGTGGAGSHDGDGGAGASPEGLRVPGTSAYSCSAAEGVVPDLRLERVASGFASPVLISHAPDDPRLFVVERDGRIRLVQGEEPASVPFLDISELVRSEEDGAFGEQGLLGLAFSPNHAEDGRFFVHYTGRPEIESGVTTIAEYRVSSNPDAADPSSARIVLELPQPAANHNGGTIAFGPDGYLYVGLGDGGGGNDAFGNGQDPSTLLGTILRIDPSPSGGAAYDSPPGNLSQDIPGAAPEVWDYGLRNPYRFNFDACQGDLYIGDVGQDAWEELNVELLGDGRKNYGWPLMEGKLCRDGNPCNTAGLSSPAFDYPHLAKEQRSIVGGAVYRGSSIPGLLGHYLFADSYTREVWRTTFDRASKTITSPVLIEGLLPSSIQLLSAIQNGPDGELYFVSMQDGTIHRLKAQ